jgi:hypothetical protein
MTPRALPKAWRMLAHLGLTSLLFACGSASVAQPSAKSDVRGSELATALAELADAGDEMDLNAVADRLHLPGLVRGLRWGGSISRKAIGQSFRADFQPADSPLGIMDVHAAWTSLGIQGMRTELRLLIKAEACPGPPELALATHGQILTVQAPAVEFALRVPTDKKDDVVSIRRMESGSSINGNPVCGISVERRPMTMLLVEPLD